MEERIKLQDIKVGDKIKLTRDRRRYTVQARDERFIIMTKPHFKTVLYSILDTKDMVASTCSYWTFGFETREDCEEVIEFFKELPPNADRLSHRRMVRFKYVGNLEVEFLKRDFCTPL